MKKELFGEVNGREVYLYTLENSHGMKVTVSSFGALIIRIWAPDHNGNFADVALGYDRLEQYLENGKFYGAVVAPNANRIGGAKFTLEGKTYELSVNDNGNNLHSHRALGGNRDFSVLYELTEENGLRITYDVVSDADTILNLTNHCYFNLDGHGAGQITDHELQLFSHAYTPADAESIPNGDILRVEGTPMDFTEPHLIGERIDADFDQLKMAGGYDHNWVLDNYTGQVRKIAVVKNSDKSRTMEVYTDLPGVQFYSGNSRDLEAAKDGKTYGYRAGLALETQFYPDTPNKPQFPSSVFGPDRPYHTVTEYRFV